MFEKVAEHRSRVSSLAKTSVTTSCQSSDGWMFEKTVKWSVGETKAFSDCAQIVIQNIIYKPNTTRTNKTSILGC